jgi:serine protease
MRSVIDQVGGARLAAWAAAALLATAAAQAMPGIPSGVKPTAPQASAAADEAIPRSSRRRASPVTQLIVRFRDETRSGARVSMTVPRVDGLSKSAGTQLLYRRPMAELAHVFRLREALSQPAAHALAARLRRDPAVADVEVDELLYPQSTPNDTLYVDTVVERLWSLKAPTTLRAGGVNLPAAWQISRGKGVVVAVIDTGIFRHDDLEANIIPGFDFIGRDEFGGGFLVANDGDGRDADPSDPGDWITAEDAAKPIFSGCEVSDSSWHGTHVAGTVAAVGDNGLGVVGVAYEAKVLAVRALGKCFGYGSDITDAIRWSAGAAPASGSWSDLGIPTNPAPARVVNLSLGASTNACPPTRQSAINAAIAAGAVVVAATGNDRSLTIGSPASCLGVIAVTSHTVEGDNSSFANVGVGTSISAPGGGRCSTAALNCLPDSTSGAVGTLYRSVLSTISDGTRGPGTDRTVFGGEVGTSMATPHVSGVAALLFSHMPTLKPETVRSLITASARPFPAGTYCSQQTDARCGTGMLDATRAFQRLADLAPTVTASTPTAVVRNGAAVQLNATVTAKPGAPTVFTYLWQQTAGPAVTLVDTSALQTSFTAPTPGSAMSFRFTATDADGIVASRVVDLRANGLPVVAPLAALTVESGAAVSLRATATDPENDALTFTATGVPDGATFRPSGEFTWPAASPAGTYTLSITANDGFETGAPVSVTITVNPPPRGGGGALDLLGLGLLGLWLASRILHRRRRGGSGRASCIV